MSGKQALPSTLAGNCTTTATIPSSWGSTSLYYPQYPLYSNGMQISKAENGWILIKDGKTYVFVNVEDIVPVLKDEK